MNEKQERIYSLDQALDLSRGTPLWNATYAIGREGTRFALLSLSVLGLWKLLELLGAL